MSKRNKKIRSNRSGLKLETLEQRQLLATIVSGGTSANEVLSNVKTTDFSGNTNTYDQVVLTGSSIAVKADAGQVVRVDWLDADGDIVRAEFSGTGTMAINLAGASAAPVAASKYTTTNTYMQGNATVTVSGSDATTNIQLYSLGKNTAFNGVNNAIFGGGATLGGNHNMNIAALVILADNTTVGNNFNDIRAGNVIFGATAGVVGIAADNIDVKGVINIGDIIADGTASPVLKLGAFTDTTKVTVAGGALKAASTAADKTIAVTSLNVKTLVVQNNVDSNGTAVPTQVVTTPTAVPVASITYSSGLGALTIDGSTVTQATLDTYASSFLGDITLTNGLASGLVFRALQFGNITVNGNLAGLITTDANDSNTADAKEQSVGNVTVNGDITDKGGIESAQSIGNVTVTGKIAHTAVFTTSTLFTTTTQALANGVITTLGKTTADASIGNISVTGDVTLGTGKTDGTITTADAETLINAGGLGTTTLSANIGTITIGGKLNTYTGATAGVIQAQGVKAAVGAITVTSDAVLSTTSTTTPVIAGTTGVGAITANSILIKATGNSAVASTGGSIGNIKTTGPAVATTNPTVAAGIITLNGGGAGLSGAKGVGTITSGSDFTAAAGATIVASAGTIGDITVGGAFNTAANITATDGSVGNITATGSITTTGSIISAAIVTAGSTGNVGNITAGSASATTTVAAITAAGTVGNISTTGNGGNLALTGTITGNKGVGNITVANGSWDNTGGAITATTGTIGNLTDSAVGPMTIAAAVTATAGSIGNITVAKGGLTVSALVSAGSGGTTGTIGNILVTAGNLTITAGGFSAQKTAGTDWTGSSIGNVTVSAGKITGANNNIEFQANKIGDISVTGATATANLLTNVIFSAKGVNVTSAKTASIGNITLDNTLGTSGAIAVSTASATTANTGTGFSSTGSIGNVSITTVTGGQIIPDATTGFVIRAGSSEMGADSPTLANGAAVKTTTTDNVGSVSIGTITITGNLSSGALNAGVNTAGAGLIIASGIDFSGAGIAYAHAKTTTGETPGTALTTGSIGNITINDLPGALTRTTFGSSTITENGTAAVTSTSAIVADVMAQITVNNGTNLLNVGTTGNALRGVIGAGLVSTTDNFVGNATNNLVVVVL